MRKLDFEVVSNCVLCGCQKNSSIAVHGNTKIVKCTNCGLIYQNPRPTQESLRFLYNGDYQDLYLGKSKGLKKLFTYRFRRTFGRIPPGKILDIGCSTGEFLIVAAEHGWIPYGVEPSKSVVENQIPESLRANIFVGLFEQSSYPDTFFQGIHMSHVLEHVSDPVATLSEVHRILAPNGLLVIEVPNEANMYIRHRIANMVKGRNANSSEPNLHQHLFYFTKRTLVMLIKTAGFQIERVYVEGLGRPGQLEAILRTNNWKIRLAKLLLHFRLDEKVGLAWFIDVEASRA